MFSEHVLCFCRIYTYDLNIIFYLSSYFSTHTRLNGNLYAYFDKRSYKMCRAARRSSSSKEIQKKKRHSERASSEICSRQYTRPCGNQAHPLFACSNLVGFVEHIFFFILIPFRIVYYLFGLLLATFYCFIHKEIGNNRLNACSKWALSNSALGVAARHRHTRTRSHTVLDDFCT